MKPPPPPPRRPNGLLLTQDEDAVGAFIGLSLCGLIIVGAIVIILRI